MCSDNDDASRVSSLSACSWCFLLAHLPATSSSAPESRQSPLRLVYGRQAITSNVAVRCDHHYLLRGDHRAMQFSSSARRLPEASLDKLTACLGCWNKMRCISRASRVRRRRHTLWLSRKAWKPACMSGRAALGRGLLCCSAADWKWSVTAFVWDVSCQLSSSPNQAVSTASAVFVMRLWLPWCGFK